MLLGDFHMHTYYSKDCNVRPEDLVRRARQVGLTCIAVTDHNSIAGAQAVQRIAPFRVIIAEEISTPDGEITGLFLKEPVPKGLPPREAVRRVKEQGGLVSIPHPFDRIRRSPMTHAVLKDILPDIDLVEVFNARTTLPSDVARCRAFAEEHALIKSGGSDAHTCYELGGIRIEFPDFDGTPQGFKEAMRHATIRGHLASPFVHVASKYAKWCKKLGLLPRHPETTL